MRTREGGTVWSVGSLVIGVLGSLRFWTLVPGALDRFVYGACRPSTSSVQLTWAQVGAAIAAGVFAIVFAEMGARNEGNRWLSMVGSVLGVSLVIGGAVLVITLAARPIPCGL